MTGLASMQLAVEIATRQRDKVRQDLALAQQLLRAAQEQANQLEGYAQETQARWVMQYRGHLTPELMRHYYQFMDKLYQAIAMQGQVLQDAGQRVLLREKTLLEAEFTLATRETVRDNMHRATAKRRDKLEQKQLDELAAQQHRKNVAGYFRGGEL